MQTPNDNALPTRAQALQRDESPSLVAPPGPADLGRRQRAAAWLVSRVYRGASLPLRADLLACLMRPLGTLSMAAIASGAFAVLLRRPSGPASAWVPLVDAARFTGQQIHELARFAVEVNPSVLQQVAALVARQRDAVAASAISASGLLRLCRAAVGPSPRIA